ncbi:hypothetical protein JW998_11295 [candidate division KSB1 bacterium]|nr:hypothetical protein [candidate division KSB1 bacterium]
MAISKSVVSWLVMIALVLVFLAAGWWLWSSLQDSRALLAEQKKELERIVKANETLTAVRDSLHRENDRLAEKEKKLLQEKYALDQELQRLRLQHQSDMARIDTLWQAESVISSLDSAFPEWAGQFWQAKTPNGLEGLIAPRFFSSQVLEIMAQRDGSQTELDNCHLQVANRDSLLQVKEQRIGNLQTEVTALDTTYANLYDKYLVLDEKYNQEVKRGWLKMGVSNAVTFVAGGAIGYLVGKQ